MAHFARIENNIVTEVIVVANDALDPDNEEASGLQMLADSGLTGNYVQCSYNGNPVGGVYRGPYPGPGWAWDGKVFVDPNPSPTVEPEGPDL